MIWGALFLYTIHVSAIIYIVQAHLRTITIWLFPNLKNKQRQQSFRYLKVYYYVINDKYFVI